MLRIVCEAFSTQNDVVSFMNAKYCASLAEKNNNQQIENSLQHIYIKCNTFQCVEHAFSSRMEMCVGAIFPSSATINITKGISFLIQ